MIVLIPKCIDECNICCIERQYYSEEYKHLGIRGTELLSQELSRIKSAISRLRRRTDENGNKIQYNILPGQGISSIGALEPEIVDVYQIMGRIDGKVCPFLSTEEENIRNSNGSLKCLIYDKRPLTCKAYPVVGILDKIHLDARCPLSKTLKYNDIRSNINYMHRIQRSKVPYNNTMVEWRYATGVGEGAKKGWVRLNA